MVPLREVVHQNYVAPKLCAVCSAITRLVNFVLFPLCHVAVMGARSTVMHRIAVTTVSTDCRFVPFAGLSARGRMDYDARRIGVVALVTLVRLRAERKR